MSCIDIELSQANIKPKPRLLNTGPFDIFVAAALDRGKVRKLNEDNYYRSDWDPDVNPAEGRLYLIVDGVGGNKGGGLASLIACEKMPQYFFDPAVIGLPLAIRLRSAIDRTNEEIFAAGEKSKQFKEMGCAFVAFAEFNGEAVVANLGDSRAYCHREDELHQLTNDHTVAQELLRLGYIDSSSVDKHHSRHTLTRVLGGHKREAPDIRHLQLQEGDHYILCSDGLYNEVSDAKIKRLISQSKPGEKIVKELADAANDHGGHDNIVVMSLVVSGYN